MYWSHLECTVAVICACLPALRIIFTEVSVQNLRKFASKFSLRSIAARNSSENSLRQVEEPFKLRDLPVAPGGVKYRE